MAYFDDVGPLTWIAAGETQYWTWGFGDVRKSTLGIAGAAVDRNGSAYAILSATSQGKQLRIDGVPRHEFHVTIRNDGTVMALYNLQVVTFP